jgi:hypothetical protein
MSDSTVVSNTIFKVVFLLRGDSASRLSATCKELHKKMKQRMFDTIPLMRALYFTVKTLRPNEPRTMTPTSFTCKDLTVSMEDANSLRITCTHEKHPYTNVLSCIRKIDGSRFKLFATYTNHITGNAFMSTLTLNAPWEVHRNIMKVDDVYAGKLRSSAISHLL